MEEKKTVEKLTYEQLENVASQLQQRVVGLQNQLNGINSAMSRLGILFRVLETKDVFSKDFVSTCAKEIEELIIIKDEDEVKETFEKE